LDQDDMNTVVQILQKGLPDLTDVDGNGIELDVNTIPDHVLEKLSNFVRPLKDEAGKFLPASDEEYEDSKADATYTKSRRKHKPMSAQQQELQIAQVQSQLDLFQAGSQVADDEGADTSDGASQSSSSEEE